MSTSDKTLKFEWLTTPDTRPSVIRPEDNPTVAFPFPIPPELGHGSCYGIELMLGMSLFRGEHHFKPAAVGKLIPLAKIEMAFPDQTFIVEVVRGGNLLQRGIYPEGEFLARPGLDVFRITDRLEMVPIMDGSFDIIGTSLVASWNKVSELIGDGVAERLKHNLGFDTEPKTLAKQIPLHVSAHLHNALPMTLVGPVKKLYCQARVLDYFEALIESLSSEACSLQVNAKVNDRVNALHEYLLQTEGKLPTLDELSAQFGCSARSLNDAFAKVYGMSIYGFITSQRLNDAHAAILGSAVPLKKLAERLGYAHFNHFSTAFKKKFGYPPGSLRRQK